MSTKLSQKLERINASVARIREKTNLPNAVIEDVATAVEQLGTSGGETVKTNIYKVASIEERDAIADMVEGDMCVVHTSSIANMQVTDSVTSITFPATVVLPSAIADDTIFISMSDENEDYYIDIMLSSNSFNFYIMGAGGGNIAYTSTDGITYTRTDSNGETITFGAPISCKYPEEWNDILGYFMQVGGITFEGLFEYKNSAWNYASLGLSPDLSTIFPGTTVYTNSGFQSGLFPLKNGSWNSTFGADSVKTIQDAMHNLDNHTRLFAGAMSTTAIIDIFNKVLKGDCSYLFGSTPIAELDLTTWDFSNVTSLQGAFNGAKNLTTVNLQNTNLSNVVDFRDTFLGATALTTVDFRGATFSSEQINVLGMFENMNIEHILFDDGVRLKVNSLSAFEGMNNTLGPTDEAAESFLRHVDDSALTTGALNYAFRYCSRLTRLDFSHLDLSNLTGIIHGIMNCNNLQFLDLRTVDFQKFTNTNPNIGSFAACLTGIPTDCLIIVGDATQKSILQSNRPALTNIKTVEEVEPKPSSTPVAILTKGNEDMSVDSFTLASDDVVTAFDELNAANNLTPSEDNIYVMGYNMMGEFDIMGYYLYSNGNYYNCNAAYVTLGNQLYMASSSGFGECAAIYSGTKDLKPFKLYYLCSDNTYDVGGTYNNETIVVSGTMDETATGVGRYKLTTSQRSTVSYLTIDPSFSNWAPESFEDFFYYFRELKNPNNIIGLENINMSNCTNINNMFKLFPSLHKIDLSFLDLSKVTQAGSAFSQSGLIPDIIFEKLQTNIIENFSSIFYGATNESVPVFDVSHGVNMYGLFNNMTKLKSHPKLNIPAGANINAMFVSCYAIPVIDVSHINLTDFLVADANNVNNFFFQSAGSRSLASEGAYADGIPYVYVKDADDRNFILNSMSSNSRPNNWSTSNIIVGSPN